MIDRIEELIKRATTGPWDVYDQAADEGWDYEQCCISSRGDTTADWIAQDIYRNDDAAFIAHMRQLAPLMLEVVKAADAEHPAQAMGHDPHCHTCWTIERVKAYAQTLREEGE